MYSFQGIPEINHRALASRFPGFVGQRHTRSRGIYLRLMNNEPAFQSDHMGIDSQKPSAPDAASKSSRGRRTRFSA
jgi:hypothetical protein